MHLPQPPLNVARVGLRALVTVATIDGQLHALERRLIAAVMQQLLHLDHDLDTIEPIEPAAVAAEVRDPGFRERIVRGCAMIAVIDGEAQPAELDYLNALGKHCGIKDPNLTSLKHMARGRMRLLRYDLARRFVRTDLFKTTIRDEGLLAFLRSVKEFFLKQENPDLSARYRALAELPEGTLGRAYYRFIHDADLRFPGEVGGFPETIVVHDCMHVLAEYDNDAAGEALISAFHGGHHSEDLFSNVMFGIMQFHLGIAINPRVHASQEEIVPEKLVEAFVRGSQCNGDPIREFKPWEHWSRTLDELRLELNIVPHTILVQS